MHRGSSDCSLFISLQGPRSAIMTATLPLGREVFLEQTAYFSIPRPPPPSFRFHPTSASVHSLEQGLIFHVYMATSKHHSNNMALSAKTQQQFQTETHYKPAPFGCEGFNCIRIARAMAHREYFSLTSLSSFKKNGLYMTKGPN